MYDYVSVHMNMQILTSDSQRATKTFRLRVNNLALFNNIYKIDGENDVYQMKSNNKTSRAKTSFGDADERARAAGALGCAVKDV